ncbi:MAG TPA: UDP-glucose/GDP-mannose dehydrogenase family protein [Pirellulales bacterium]|nr:UDP-glucose/GDP-mannose dehydrogenase family protein [Pirellulales bacterium]
MKIAVIGTGYVGLVTGTCFADSGNDVTCIDIDQRKVDTLRRGEIPIYEPGLTELVKRNTAAGRLKFTTDYPSGVSSARVVFLAVGTPPREDGSADLKYLLQAIDQIAPLLKPNAIVITKSTVPVGTCAKIEARLKELTGRACDVASNPEFLKEGAAIEDFTKPDRVVVGVRRPEVGDALRELYAPFLRNEHPFLCMSPESSEMTKYAANAMLSTKISFVNEMANICECIGADINDVRRGMGFDSRIGFQFMFPGVGYGGSCFPKDVRALSSVARENGYDAKVLDAVDAVNRRQQQVQAAKIERHFGGRLTGRILAVWGLAFKPRTDDIREAPALALIDRLLELGAKIQVHDPEAMNNVRDKYGDKLTYCKLPLDALHGADALAIMTEWAEFRQPDFDEMKNRMKSPVIFDGRNIFECDAMRQQGFVYYSIGRKPVM